MAEFSYRIGTAQKGYRCARRAEQSCGKQIQAGDTYFCVTARQNDRYRSIRYCLECGEKLYPEEMGKALAAIKRVKNRKTAAQKIGRIRFLNAKSRGFRSRPTPPEQYLWDFLRNGRLGMTFYRQKVLHGYVVDFWCPEKQLAIELDGRHHRNHKEKDEMRDQILRSHGIRVIRFPSSAVYYDMDQILETIRKKHNPDDSA